MVDRSDNAGPFLGQEAEVLTVRRTWQEKPSFLEEGDCPESDLVENTKELLSKGAKLPVQRFSLRKNTLGKGG